MCKILEESEHFYQRTEFLKTWHFLQMYEPVLIALFGVRNVKKWILFCTRGKSMKYKSTKMFWKTHYF